jgi:hypothetical protein
MTITEKQALAVRCPTCGAKPSEKCKLITGEPRTDAHRDRRLVVSEKEVLATTGRGRNPTHE